MFGMGLFEILLIAVIAIIALGPEKLPKAMVEVARFLKKFKSGVEDAKSTLDNELNISEMREEANKFKAQIEDAKSSVKIENVDLGVNDLLKDDLSDDLDDEIEEKPKKKEKVSFKSQSKKKKEPKEQETPDVQEAELIETPTQAPAEEPKVNKADKFKVNQGEEA